MNAKFGSDGAVADFRANIGSKELNELCEIGRLSDFCQFEKVLVQNGICEVEKVLFGVSRIIDDIRMAAIDHAIIDLALYLDPAAVFCKFFQRKRPQVVRIEAAGCGFFEMAAKV